MPPRFAELGDLHAGIDEAVCDLRVLLEWVEREESARRRRGAVPAELPEDAGRAEARAAVAGEEEGRRQASSWSTERSSGRRGGRTSRHVHCAGSLSGRKRTSFVPCRKRRFSSLSKRTSTTSSGRSAVCSRSPVPQRFGSEKLAVVASRRGAAAPSPRSRRARFAPTAARADVVEVAVVGVQAEQQRRDRRAAALLPAHADDDAVGRLVRLHLHDAVARAGEIREPELLRDHTVEAGRLQRLQPRAALLDVVGDRRERHPGREPSRAPRGAPRSAARAPARRPRAAGRRRRTSPGSRPRACALGSLRDGGASASRRSRACPPARSRSRRRAPSPEAGAHRSRAARGSSAAAAGRSATTARARRRFVSSTPAEPVPFRLVAPGARLLGQLGDELRLHRRERNLRAQRRRALHVGHVCEPIQARNLVALCAVTAVVAGCGGSRSASAPTTALLSGVHVDGTSATFEFHSPPGLRPARISGRAPRSPSPARAGKCLCADARSSS